MNWYTTKRSIIFFLLLAATQLFSHMSLAKDNLLCFGGISSQNKTNFVELIETPNNPNNFLTGSIVYGNNLIIFTVQKDMSNLFHYRAHIYESEIDLINGTTQQIPARMSAPLENNQELFMECKPYSTKEYCRTHTC